MLESALNLVEQASLAVVAFLRWFLETIIARENQIRSVSEVAALIAFIAGAGVFTFNQWRELEDRRERRYEAASERYKEFLEKCLEYPELSLWPAEAKSPEQLLAGNTGDKSGESLLYQRDVLFDVLTGMLEFAFLKYSKAWSSYRKQQWHVGWESYIDEWLDRDDYAEWWHRVILLGNASAVTKRGFSQYDLRFENHIRERVKHAVDRMLSRRREAKRLEEARKGATGTPIGLPTDASSG
jgi:hypothetical protein